MRRSHLAILPIAAMSACPPTAPVAPGPVNASSEGTYGFGIIGN